MGIEASAARLVFGAFPKNSSLARSDFSLVSSQIGGARAVYWVRANRRPKENRGGYSDLGPPLRQEGEAIK